MNGPDRFRTLVGRPPAAADGDSPGCLEGVDPVTGLPVLIYDFEGEPLLSPGEIESPNIPRVLWSGSEGGKGRIVAALAPGWRRLDEGAQPLTLEQLLDAVRAVRDASSAGVAHGDLAPYRFLLVEGRLQVEGYGVPRDARTARYPAPELDDRPTPAGDVYALAMTVGELGVEATDETVAAVLEQCAEADPHDRPSAEELYLALESLAREALPTRNSGRRGSAATGGPAGSTGAATPGSDPEGAPAVDAQVPSAATPAPGSAAPPDPTGAEPPAYSEPETAHPASAAAGRAPNVAGTAPSAAGPASAAAGPASGAAGNEPPAIPDRATRAETGGEGAPRAPRAHPPLEPPAPSEEPRERRMRLTLLGALMAGVVILALLALYGPRGSQPPPPEPLEDVVYVVEVEVVPDDLPPVTLHVVRAPEGSSLARSDSIGTAPRHLALDRAGTWAFRGTLQDRSSEVVEVEVPEERSVTLVMPQVGSQ